MKNFIGLVLLVVAFSLTSAVYAGEITGTIVKYAPTKWDVFIFNVSNKPSSLACDSNVGYAIPTTTSWGKAAIASVIAAMANGHTVTVLGDGKCSYWSNTEDLMYITVLSK